MRDRLIVFEPLIGLADRFALGTAQGVSILLGRDHGFEQMNHCGKLVGAELVEQVMGVLYVSGHACSSIEPFRAKRRQRLKNSKA
jgi:hypothetical protein